ncbi:alpha-amylase [Fomitiporia mediterranea MF3/22]|uniref:alpha-amylase n=1 Tax=Fomitiporia mediterranea (strain MF3/22) TaxID=694068 RepID=UPI0004407BF9|nr:alpha-amylase [Fomitiporia mediterranea MF3/22]EJD02103.1 alpha-amylase [Fomitiporia mediterranea MF3/22]
MFPFTQLSLSLISLLLLQYLPSAYTANADAWRTRSIYQIIVDRYALPKGADTTACDPAQQTWCGGTWNTIRENLDYIQDAGFTAIWISPVSKNYEGPRTPYGDPYHGYWISDASQLNDKFGTADDLKGLSDDLHKRGMYLMVDVVVNNVMSLSNTSMDYQSFLFKEPQYYHPYCPVDFSNDTSVQMCWLGDTNVYLPDVKTEDPFVVSTYNSWIQQLVQEFNIDGLRIDAAKHVNNGFWPGFCSSAGVFCIGEVFDADPAQASQYQGPTALDSILHYPMYNALTAAFTIPGTQNMSAMPDMISRSASLFKDPTLLGNFLENQDVPRWGNLSVDPQSMYNAMTFTFMSDGIPIVYYGQEQGFHGSSDPFNREPLWPSGYANTTSYQLVSTLNQFRNFLVNTSDFATQPMKVLASNDAALAINKGNVISVVTNVGSPVRALHAHIVVAFVATRILECRQVAVGSGGAMLVDYSKGGKPMVFFQESMMSGTGLCGYPGSNKSTLAGLGSSSAAVQSVRWGPLAVGLAVGSLGSLLLF